MMRSILVIFRIPNLTEEARSAASDIVEILNGLLEAYGKDLQKTYSTNKVVRPRVRKGEHKTCNTLAKCSTGAQEAGNALWIQISRRKGAKKVRGYSYASAAKKMPAEQKIDNTEKVLSMAEGPEKRFVIFQSMKERDPGSG